MTPNADSGNQTSATEKSAHTFLDKYYGPFLIVLLLLIFGVSVFYDNKYRDECKKLGGVPVAGARACVQPGSFIEVPL